MIVLKKRFARISPLLLLLLTLGSLPIQAAEGSPAERGSLRVTGQAVVSCAPDLAYITLGVETKDSSAAEASAENARLMKEVYQALQTLGLTEREIETSGYNIYSSTQVVERGTAQETTITSYYVQNRITITTTALEKVGPIIDAAVQAGANQVQGVRFDLADKQELQRRALHNAVVQARGKAEVMAAAAGVVIGGLASLTEEYGSYAPMMETALVRGSLGAKDASTTVTPGEIEVSAQVTLVFWF